MKIISTCFGLRPTSGSLYGAWLKLHYVYFVRLCGAVAAWLEIDVCVVCCAELDCQSLPEDGRRPKHVGAIFMLFLM
jgi:hypothetical protein